MINAEAVGSPCQDFWWGEGEGEVASGREAAGKFALSWRAHDLDYGIPATVEGDLKAQRCVIANVSRSVIDLARSRYKSRRVVNVTAPIAVLARRIAKCGREDAAAVEKRMARVGYALPPGDDILHIENTGSVEVAVDRFTYWLRETVSAELLPHGGKKILVTGLPCSCLFSSY